MKRFYFVLGVLTLALFISCGTATNVFDDSLPIEETALLTISGEWTVTAYNGIDVELEKPLFGNAGFTIPAGETELVLDLYYRVGNVIYTARDFIADYNFQAGRSYLIRFWWVEEGGKIPATNWTNGKPALIISDAKDVYTALHYEEILFR